MIVLVYEVSTSVVCQVEKLRAQVSAQESAAAETEAELAARRAAALTLKEKERALQAEVTDAEAEAEAITAQLRKTVLAVSQVSLRLMYFSFIQINTI